MAVLPDETGKGLHLGSKNGKTQKEENDKISQKMLTFNIPVGVVLRRNELKLKQIKELKLKHFQPQVKQ